eukprot:6179083-Pleurochrysis_carterae.AAC.1
MSGKHGACAQSRDHSYREAMTHWTQRNFIGNKDALDYGLGLGCGHTEIQARGSASTSCVAYAGRMIRRHTGIPTYWGWRSGLSLERCNSFGSGSGYGSNVSAGSNVSVGIG